jgi:hypothetical protein
MSMVWSVTNDDNGEILISSASVRTINSNIERERAYDKKGDVDNV